MTAEAAVMNSIGVALAADSAVTLSAGPERQKVYSSTDKLFQLINGEPVGLLTYGNAQFLGLPWETIVKVFRKRRTLQALPALADYGTEFLAFLGETSLMLTEEAEVADIRVVVAEFLLELRDYLSDEIDKAIGAAGRQLPKAEIRPIVKEALPALLRRTLRDDIPQCSKQRQSQLRALHGDTIRETSKAILAKLPFPYREVETACLEVIHRGRLGRSLSGIVIAGFGEDEYMPSLVHYQIQGRALGAPRVSGTQPVKIAPGAPAAVQAFAQSAPARAFMEGVDPRLLDRMEAEVTDAFAALGRVLSKRIAALDSEFAAKLPSVVEQLGSRLIQHWEEVREEVWGPIVRMVGALPKDELAAMAEALVNLSKFKTRVSPGHETVGGPVDVALISKGDGFVWVRRKHYFESNLNPRAIGRMGKDC